jgi:hypothetical protein
MASAELSRRVGKVVGYPPLSEMGEAQRREFHEALLDADSFEDPAPEVAGGDFAVRAEPAEAARRRQRLAVVPQDVVNAGDWWPVADPAVASAGVVVLEPVWQRGPTVV